jgi:hypothetical protein
MTGIPFEAREQVHLGIIGVGGRGTSLLQDLLAIEKVEVKAICDLVGEKVARAQKAVTEAGQPDPAGFSKGECDFKNLIQLELDIVYTATPWNWHVQGLALAWTFLLPLSADTLALPQSVGSRWITQRQDTFDISYEHGDRKWAQHSCTVLPAAHYRQLRSAHLHAPDLPSSFSDMRLSSRKAWSGPPANDPTSFPGRSFILDGHS